MKKIFWKDPYQNILDTKVLSVDNTQVTFEQTIAFSESGGQESDRACIIKKSDNSTPIYILESEIMADHSIVYTLPENHGLVAGDEIIMEIDWTRRYKLMRLHFCCELVLVLVNRLFGNKEVGCELRPDEIDVIGPRKTGAHMKEDYSQVTFLLSYNISKHLSALLLEFNKIIDNDYPIEVGYTNKENQERYWRVPGIATVPCGGTHVKSTSEVGYANFKRVNGGKGKEQIRITLKDPSAPESKYPTIAFFAKQNIRPVKNLVPYTEEDIPEPSGMLCL